MRSDLAAAQSKASSRMEVIQQLMERTETSTSQGQAAAAELSRLQVHCRTLSVNLETNAKVIEKLVELNSELMDNLNTATASAEIKSKQQQQQQQGAGSATVTTAACPGTRCESSGGGINANQSVEGAAVAAGSPVGASATQRNGLHGTGAGTPGAALASGTMAAAAAADLARAGVPRVASRGGGLVAAGSAVSSSSRVGEPDSLTDAFAAFLKDETPPKPATAAVLATPPPLPGPLGAHHPSSGAASKGRGGGGRVFGLGIMNVVRYVAGSDRSAQGSEGAPGPSSGTRPP
ncbi:hypothetical protein Vafri_16747 [Volvox africanus]|nr:hypothetical protein Vafri_16747 [Volvox africanus]